MVNLVATGQQDPGAYSYLLNYFLKAKVFLHDIYHAENHFLINGCT